MRRRLLASTLTIAVATLVLLGAPLAFVLDRVLHDEARSRVEREAERIAREVDRTLDHSPAPRLTRAQLPHVPTGDRVVVTLSDGTPVSSGPAVDDALVASVPGAHDETVRLESPVGSVDDRVQGALLAVVLLALLGLGAALVLALVQSTRLAAPLARLARGATRLGEGDFSLATPRSGVPEIDEIAEALDLSATRIEALLRAERDFSAHASHQLRSALTGLQLRLDELAASDDDRVRAEAEAALEQSARLDATIDELLALARTGRAGIVTEFDLAQLARQHAEDARLLLARRGRRIVVDAPRPVRVHATVGALGQILEILLSNAVRHGDGTVTVSVGDDGQRAVLAVSDEGPGFDDARAARLFEPRPDDLGHGIGLSIARTLTATEGGTLALARARPPTVRVTLPLG